PKYLTSNFPPLCSLISNTWLQMNLQKKSRFMQQDDVHAAFAKLLTELNKADAPYSLSLANRLYGEQSYEFVKEFLNNTKKYYKAELESVDFKGNPEKARVHINSWVEKQTKGQVLVYFYFDYMSLTGFYFSDLYGISCC
uniref:Serpin domain-containing protein n=1 Tax=Amphilophus citrinellus TaxID=61819 RepID=A0A3Q0RTX7_AMPCI